MTNNLYWLPKSPEFEKALKESTHFRGDPEKNIKALSLLANHDLDLVSTATLDRQLQQWRKDTPEFEPKTRHLKLALLSSATVDHLIASIRVGCLRREILVDVYTGAFNQYRQEIFNPSSGLYRFQPDVIVLMRHAQDAGLKMPPTTPIEMARRTLDQQVNETVSLWQAIARESGAVIVQSTIVIPPEVLLGHADAIWPAAPANLLRVFNEALKQKAPENKVLVFDQDWLASSVGKRLWCDTRWWHHAKQDVPPGLGPLWGDHVARILAAIRGNSKKCLVLDLDNTLWGGVIGDDGLDGIVLGQGNGAGEAYQSFQMYTRELRQRGVILAVCSKNEAATARLPFEKHPEMVLKLDDISCFVANWQDKATNVRRIASELNIGLDSLVFVDDNPAERELIRQSIPEVAVLELPEDPAAFTAALSDSGYFEAIRLTPDDRLRTEQYVANAKRTQLADQMTNLDDFLKSLQMTVEAGPFDETSLPRVAQLINKSKQYNLTTRRYTEAQVRLMLQSPDLLTLQARLQDRFGDNGLISVIIARQITESQQPAMVIDTWLMSCRVLGRQVEQQLLNVLVGLARARGAVYLRGDYIPTAKNGMVADHYPRLGFEPVTPAPKSKQTADSTSWILDLRRFDRIKTHIQVKAMERVTRNDDATS